MNPYEKVVNLTREGGKNVSVIELLNETLKQKWKFERTMKVQDEMIPAMLEGKDIVAESPTGSGKTLAYVLPMLHKLDGSKKVLKV